VSSTTQTRRILLLTAGLCVVWMALSSWLPRPELAETNYVANRLRIERFLLDSAPSNVVVGTSISGRLQPSFFSGTSLASMANLGLDGANPDTGLTLVLKQAPPPERVFLEIHRLVMPPGANDTQLLNLTQGPGLELSRWAALTRAMSRPSTVLYGWLKGRQSGGGSTVTPGSQITRPGTVTAEPDPKWAPRIREKVRQVEARGTKVYLLRLPVGRENPADSQAKSFADEASTELGLPLVDLYRLSQAEGVEIRYTDGLHLTPQSAVWLAGRLAQAVSPK
jgi:hypothetical protein